MKYMLNHWLSEYKNKIIELRHWLHAHPEVGFDEVETAKHLQGLLISGGYEIIQTPEMSNPCRCLAVSTSSKPTSGCACNQ
jgi:metal-dependent amidase/aminoacylase/carboxypeptidase family protein